MARTTGFTDDFGMDTITLAGELSAKLAAMREAGFGQVMHAWPRGWQSFACKATKRPAGLH